MVEHRCRECNASIPTEDSPCHACDDELARLRSATRVRVTAEETPTGSGYCLAWPAFLSVPVLITADIVRAAHRAYPEWLPLPERPAK